jgi:hypothetical protein
MPPAASFTTLEVSLRPLEIPSVPTQPLLLQTTKPLSAHSVAPSSRKTRNQFTTGSHLTRLTSVKRSGIYSTKSRMLSKRELFRLESIKFILSLTPDKRSVRRRLLMEQVLLFVSRNSHKLKPLIILFISYSVQTSKTQP